ncbi:translation factor SUA5 [Granulicella pectinivorans]|uniref:Threonylcarbamoyl-AMP synthase n=1 Tax=Granulicella pectinivorans TaxID=474950 RepID=A0A1I6ML18_9BACT|nr:L-threonylcarbamoyladenylate synthase [Granulicella pectinivorans]SFS16390.1 translation factor SUA5 [Granulicella pectinivorans]
MKLTERLGLDGIRNAAEILKRGGLVAFPTETVYGLGANALDAAAVAGIFEAKQRPGWDPLIVHVSSRLMVDRIAEVSDEAERLMARFWPGPLTLLLPRKVTVPDAVTSGRDLVGVRMPNHPIALELIRLAGVPIAAPSANRFGRTSPTTAAHVLTDLDGRIDAILDGGPTSVGVESTVLDVAAKVVYRPGAISLEVLGEGFSMFSGSVGESPESLPSPGVGIRHYAPRARLILVAGQAEVEQVVDGLEAQVGVMLPTGWTARAASAVFDWGEWTDQEVLAQRVFAGLRALDAAGVSVIVCPRPLGEGLGAALRDRLEKAARPR